MRIDDLIETLFKDVARPAVDANSPGEMVRSSLAGQMPGMAQRSPMSMSGAPVAPVQRSAMPPMTASAPSMPAPMGAGAPPAAAPQPSQPPMTSWLGNLASGIERGGGILSGISNVMDNPAKERFALVEKSRTEQQALTQQNQNVEYLMRKHNMPRQDAEVVARDSKLFQEYLKPRQEPTALDELNRKIKEAELLKLQKEIEGGGKDTQRLADLEQLGIDPNSAEGIIYQANGKLPESASKEIIGRQQKAKAGPQVAAGLENLRKMAESYDQTSLESAIGPWQGADPDQTGLLSAPVANMARGLGEVWNTVAGGENNLSEVRSNIRGTTEALAAAIKPLIRGPGEGVWTDADQARLVAVVGDLSQASTKEEFMRRLNAVRDRIQSNFNIKVPFEAMGGTKQDGAVDYSNMSTEELLKRARGQQ